MKFVLIDFTQKKSEQAISRNVDPFLYSVLIEFAMTTGSGTVQICPPARVVESHSIKIDEYIGNVAGLKNPNLSACVVRVSEPAEEAWQSPEFDEYVIVLEGTIQIHTTTNSATGDITRSVQEVKAGHAFFLPKGQRAKFVWPGPCTYIPLCLPAFTPENCKREVPDSEILPTAKTPEALFKLKQLHLQNEFPTVYHAAEKELWEAAKSNSETFYYPPTFDQDKKITHGSSSRAPEKLFKTLNHFYKDRSPPNREWVLLEMTVESLRDHGVETVIEGPAAVGDTRIDETDKSKLFPHIRGGIPVKAVLREYGIERNLKDGEFLKVQVVEEI